MITWLKRGTCAGLMAALVLIGACDQSKEKARRGTEAPPVTAGSGTPPAASGIVAARQPLTTIPALGPARRIAPGIVTHEAVLREGTAATRVRVYLPDPLPAGKIPCVFVAPAGSRLSHGMDLDDGDQEQAPYVRQGFAVVHYSISGPVPEPPSNADLLQAARAFKNAEAGLYNAQDAIDFALARIPQIDPNRLYTAGHSSAATLSLLVAEKEPRIKACVAYAPCTDVVQWLRPNIMLFDRQIPGFADFIRRTSPLTNASQLRCPLFLFHADDDQVVRTVDNQTFADLVKKTNPKVDFVRVPRGDHHTSMIQQGIPRAITWLKNLPQ